MLGYCAACHTLRSIVQLPNRNRTGELDYGAVEHPEPYTHRGCGGVLHETDDHAYACELCEHVVTTMDQIVVGAVRCPGVRKPIR